MQGWAIIFTQGLGGAVLEDYWPKDLAKKICSTEIIKQLPIFTLTVRFIVVPKRHETTLIIYSVMVS